MSTDGRTHFPDRNNRTLCGLDSNRETVTAFRVKVSCSNCQRKLVGTSRGVDFQTTPSIPTIGLTDAEKGLPA